MTCTTLLFVLALSETGVEELSHMYLPLRSERETSVLSPSTLQNGLERLSCAKKNRSVPVGPFFLLLCQSKKGEEARCVQVDEIFH